MILIQLKTIYVNGINKAPFHQKGGNGLISEISPLENSNKVKQCVRNYHPIEITKPGKNKEGVSPRDRGRKRNWQRPILMAKLPWFDHWNGS